jgi:rod shape-determining protein MreC
VLLVNDTSSGVGAILEKSRLQGVLKGSPSGDAFLDKVMSDEQVEPGERVLTSGGDQIFPKGLLIGYVRDAKPGADLFLKVRVRLSANLSKVEEVLIITKVDEREPTEAEAHGPVRAIDILANRLPSVPVKPPAEQSQPPVKTPDSAVTHPAGSTGLAVKQNLMRRQPNMSRHRLSVRNSPRLPGRASLRRRPPRRLDPG